QKRKAITSSTIGKTSPGEEKKKSLHASRLCALRAAALQIRFGYRGSRITRARALLQLRIRVDRISRYALASGFSKETVG
ncbi:MAG: hypothetical protein ACC628_15115, partial [Pirellulaceae bacterium]